jgi:hypothetical protein
MYGPLYWSLLGSCCSLQAVGGSAVHARDAVRGHGPSDVGGKAQQNYGSARVGMFMRRGEQTRRGAFLVDLCPRTQTYDVRSRPSGTVRRHTVPETRLRSCPAPTRCQCTQHLTLLCRSPRAEGYDSRAGEQRERCADAGDARGGSPSEAVAASRPLAGLLSHAQFDRCGLFCRRKVARNSTGLGGLRSVGTRGGASARSSESRREG